MDHFYIIRFCVRHIFTILGLNSNPSNWLNVEKRFNKWLKLLENQYYVERERNPYFLNEDLNIFFVKTSYLIYQVYQLAKPASTDSTPTSDNGSHSSMDQVACDKAIALFRCFFYLVLKFEIDHPISINPFNARMEMSILKALNYKLGISGEKLVILYGNLTVPELTQYKNFKDYNEFEASWTAHLSRHLAEQQLSDEQNEMRLAKKIQP